MASGGEGTVNAQSQRWPGFLESGVQRKSGHVVEVYPAQRVALGRGRPDPQIVGGEGQDIGVRPVAVVHAELRSEHLDERSIDGRLFEGFSQGRLADRLMAVSGASDQTPTAALVRPASAQLEQYVWSWRGSQQHQAGGAEAPPMPVSAPAMHPTVAVATGHGDHVTLLAHCR